MKRLVKLYYLLFVAVLVSLIVSCTKDITPIGLDLVEPVDLLRMGYTDTVKIVAYTVPDDSIYTQNLTVNSVDYIQLGSMYDPIFGKTTSNVYSQLFLSQTQTRFGVDPVYDSAFLDLPYASSYGDTLSNMTFHVYNLTEGVDSLHTYSYNTLSYDPDPIGEVTFQPRPHDSIYFGGIKTAATLRIPINKKFADAVLSITDTNILNSNTEFVKAFKGICIIADQQNTVGKGSILAFQMPADYFKLRLYYHNDPDTIQVYNFVISYGCYRFQNYDHHGYAEAIPALKQQLQGDKSIGEQFLFAQGLGGTKIKIEFPNLDKWYNSGKVAINDAQLILGNASTSSTFKNPSFLALRGVGEIGTTSPYSIIDETDDAGRYDGTYYSSTNTYRFRITRYIQQILLGKIRNTGLHLVIPSSTVNGSRLILNGTASPQSDLKLYIRYTKL